MKILIAEDDPIPRRLLQATLVKSGYEVVTARDGTEAWQALQGEDAPRLAILDWLMPGMDGVDVCRQVRQRSNMPYIYILLLTSKDKKEDVIVGMEAGADDYLTKPFDPHELQVRLHAGQRILDLEAALLRSYAALAQANRREGEIGARIQQTLLLGQPPQSVAGMQVAALTIPSQQIDGDFYDFFTHQEQCLDVVVGDVMGKGIPAALLGAAIKSQFLRALGHLPTGPQGLLPSPESIVALVHAAVTSQFIGLEFFATLCYARFDPAAHLVTFVDCGHTKTIRFRPNTGACDTLSGENVPLGVLEREVYREVVTPFVPGDVFCFYSDGVTEAHNPTGEMFGMARLIAIIQANGSGTAQELIDAIHHAVVTFTQSDKFADDLTCVVVKMADAYTDTPQPGPSSSVFRLPSSLPNMADANATGASITDQATSIYETPPILAHDTLEVASDLRELATLRGFVRRFCTRVSPSLVDEDGIAQLELAVNEAASNIIRHAYRGLTEARIQIEAEATADNISLRLHHHGLPFNPQTAAPPSFDGSREGGFGVYMIAHSVDAVHYLQDAEGKNTIHLIKKRR